MHALQTPLRAAARVAARLRTPTASARVLHTRWNPLLQQAATKPAASSQAAASSASPSGKHPRVESKASVVGSHVSHVLDLSQASIGQQIDLPYEITVHESQQVMWMASFQIHDRLYTSSPFAQLLHLPNHVLPFYMLLFHAISMGHVDETREVLDIGFRNATYIRPAYSGDTLKQHFTIKHLHNTSNGRNLVVTVGCELTNQRNQLIFSVDKSMLFPNVRAPEYNVSAKPASPDAQPRSHLLSHILYNCDNLPSNNSLAQLTEGQLLLHSVSRPIGSNTNMSLSTLFRWSHPSIYNLKRYREDEIVVPGGLILAAAISASSRGLFETLHERLDSCLFLNKVGPVEMIGAVSYVQSIRPIKEGMEEVQIVTLGLKNVDVARELQDVPLPVELFTQELHRKQVEALVQEKAPMLAGKIVVKAVRTVVRQSPYAMQRSIPLL